MTGARQVAGAGARAAPGLPMISAGPSWLSARGARGRASLLAAPAWKSKTYEFPGATITQPDVSHTRQLATYLPYKVNTTWVGPKHCPDQTARR